MQGALETANQVLGRLDGISSVLPDPPLFLNMYVRKEALLSSQIEGTQSSLSDLLPHESEEVPAVPLDDVAEVSSYVAAMDHGLQRLRGVTAPALSNSSPATVIGSRRSAVPPLPRCGFICSGAR